MYEKRKMVVERVTIEKETVREMVGGFAGRKVSVDKEIKEICSPR